MPWDHLGVYSRDKKFEQSENYMENRLNRLIAAGKSASGAEVQAAGAATANTEVDGGNLTQDELDARTPINETHADRLFNMLQLNDLRHLDDYVVSHRSLGKGFHRRYMQRVRDIVKMQRINVRETHPARLSTRTPSSSRSSIKTFPKLLHWAGEMRKPWEKIHPLIRNEFDKLWWLEYESMMRKRERGWGDGVRGGSNLTGKIVDCECEIRTVKFA